MTTAVRTKPAPPHGTYARANGCPGYRPPCNCEPCTTARRAYRRRYRLLAGTGRQMTVDATPAAEHLRDLRAKGATYRALIAATGLSSSAVADLLSGARRTIRARNSVRVLSVTAGQVIPRRSPLTGIGAVRRIQALRTLGWPLRELGRRTGINPATLGALTDQCRPSFRERIALVYDDLRDQDPRRHGIRKGAVTHLRNEGRREAWAPPTAWGDIDRDTEPAPRRYWRYAFYQAGAGERSRAVIADTAELAAVGCDRAEIAARIGIAWDSIAVTHSRAGEELPLSVRFAPERDGG